MRIATPRPRRLSTRLAAVVAVPLLALSACGFEAQTNQIYQPAEGANSRSGDVLILNAVVVADGSGQGTLVATLSNNTDTADRLTTISGTIPVGQVPGGKVASEVGLEVTVPEPIDIPVAGLVSTLDAGVTAESPRLVPGGYADLTLNFEASAPIELSVPIMPAKRQFADIPIG